MKTNLRPAIVSAVLGLWLITLSGCAAPTVELQKAVLTQLSLQSLEVGLDLDIFNPNQYAVPLETVDWNLTLFDAPFTQGQTEFSRSLPAGKSASVRVPLDIQFSALALGVDHLLGGRSIPWHIEGGCTFRTPAGPIRIAFDGGGSWKNPLRK